MLTKILIGVALGGAEWVLYLLVLLSVISIALILERWWFYKKSSAGLDAFRAQIRQSVQANKFQEALTLANSRLKGDRTLWPDFEAGVAASILSHATEGSGKNSPEVLHEFGSDSLTRTRIAWEKNLHVLATIGNNAPFVGLFGTVLGIVHAFHTLAQTSGSGVQSVTSGLSEALVATGVGILVAIPAVVAFNFFQKRVKTAALEAEALKSLLIGKIASQGK